MKSDQTGSVAGARTGGRGEAPSSAGMGQLLWAVNACLSQAERLLATPELSRAGELVGHLEEACQALSAIEVYLRGQEHDARECGEVVAAAQEWGHSARRLALLTEGASRFCEGWAAVIGAQAGYTAQGGQAAGPASVYRLDWLG